MTVLTFCIGAIFGAAVLIVAIAVGPWLLLLAGFIDFEGNSYTPAWVNRLKGKGKS